MNGARFLPGTIAFLILLPACAAAAPTVDEITILNQTAYDLDVEVSGARRDGWLPVASVDARSEGVAREVLDQGDVWVFRFRYQGEPVGEASLARAELEAGGWRVEVPQTVGERLEGL